MLTSFDIFCKLPGIWSFTRTLNNAKESLDFFPNSTVAANCVVDAVLESSCTNVYTPVLRSASPSTLLSTASLERSLLLSGVAKGSASFNQVLGEKNLLHYKETGIFDTYGGTKYPFSKEYFFVFNEDTKNIEKHFAQDGMKTGLFYTLGAEYTGDHLCVKDHYKASYEFPSDNFQEFSLIYNVTGPEKNYVSKTRYNLDIR